MYIELVAVAHISFDNRAQGRVNKREQEATFTSSISILDEERGEGHTTKVAAPNVITNRSKMSELLVSYLVSNLVGWLIRSYKCKLAANKFK